MVRQATLSRGSVSTMRSQSEIAAGFLGKNLILKCTGKYKLILKTDQLIQKFTWSHPGSRITKTILKKKEGREWTLLGFETYPKAIVSTIGIEINREINQNTVSRNRAAGLRVTDFQQRGRDNSVLNEKFSKNDARTNRYTFFGRGELSTRHRGIAKS